MRNLKNSSLKLNVNKVSKPFLIRNSTVNLQINFVRGLTLATVIWWDIVFPNFLHLPPLTFWSKRILKISNHLILFFKTIKFKRFDILHLYFHISAGFRIISIHSLWEKNLWQRLKYMFSTFCIFLCAVRLFQIRLIWFSKFWFQSMKIYWSVIKKKLIVKFCFSIDLLGRKWF